MQAEVALARAEHDEVFAQVHRAAREHAGMRRDGQRRGVVAHLDLVDEGAAGVAGDDVLEIHANQARVERVVDRVRREEDTARAVDANGVGQLEVIGLDGVPDFAGGKLGGSRGVKQTSDRRARAQEFLPIGRVREVGVVDEGVGREHEPVAINGRAAGQMHLDADAGERAALGEMDFGEVGLEEVHLGRVARPEGEGEGDRALVLILHGQDLAVGAVPELVFVHGIGEDGARSRRLTSPGCPAAPGKRPPKGLIFARRPASSDGFNGTNPPGPFLNRASVTL